MGVLRSTAVATLIMVLVGGCGLDDRGHIPPRAPADIPLTDIPAIDGPDPRYDPNAAPSSVPDPTPVPGAGLVLSVGLADAATGHRASVLTLTNHDTRTLSVSGYPDLKVLAADGSVLDVRVEHGPSFFAQDPGPRTTKLAPKEKVLAVLSWSITAADGEPRLTGELVSVSPGPGLPPQSQPLKTDLGSTGEVTVSAWAAKLPG